MGKETNKTLVKHVKRLTEALERMAGPKMVKNNLDAADCFVWKPEQNHLSPVISPNRIALSLIHGVDHVRDILYENTLRFSEGFPANNALLWGARGMGKSSLVKAIHADITAIGAQPLKLIELYREDISTLSDLLDILKQSEYRFLLFSDDLSFDHDDAAYKSLKAALDGGIEGRPENVLLYATSNRRHLMPRDMIENERSTAINQSEATEEKVSLSDRFGLWLGFHKCSQDDYLAMIDGYATHFNLDSDRNIFHAEALKWAATRGGRSGRVAWQFIQDIAGRQRKHLSL